jgi:hypothetical protein
MDRTYGRASTDVLLSDLRLALCAHTPPPRTPPPSGSLGSQPHGSRASRVGRTTPTATASPRASAPRRTGGPRRAVHCAAGAHSVPQSRRVWRRRQQPRASGAASNCSAPRPAPVVAPPADPRWRGSASWHLASCCSRTGPRSGQRWCWCLVTGLVAEIDAISYYQINSSSCCFLQTFSQSLKMIKIN